MDFRVPSKRSELYQLNTLELIYRIRMGYTHSVAQRSNPKISKVTLVVIYLCG
ncbi:MAG: hypothetical protein F6K25_07325 [Okeania sp. SIO2G4]|uniref:hypothetical protein n=1 Tax=unclassified Okeania TaxID=2634635 RepID=UPI0013BD55F1|nr:MULTISPECIES: hypothetical protein [unclassified Okeania]NEP05377.1 hypothetical protein [Okeania sp. SIO4D6]NEP72259.1 hypothetical protein [Okeania sp. SIO2G5]NEP94594.1 hypothetical protein [Okeania sp. SIO2F5]NEQ90538.1 hypothetical protein [Okeania sp. SIO2G4]